MSGASIATTPMSGASIATPMSRGASITTPARLPTCPVAHALGFTSAGGRGGNAAGVVFPADHAALSDVQRIAVAARLGFSETVFITSIRPAANASTCDVALRYFTPTDEVELCGHATIACIGLLHERRLLGGAKRGTLHTRAGSVAFEIRPSPSGLDVANDAYVLDGDTGHLTASAAPGRDMVYMQQLAPVLDEPLDESLEEEVACALFPEEEGSEGEGSPPRSNGGNGYGAGKKGALDQLDASWAPRVASTGLRDLMVCIQTEAALKAMRPDMRRVAELSRILGTVGIHAFCKKGSGPIIVRNFAPLFGIDEESATGTSNCALACALWESGDAPKGRPLSFSQGIWMGAPSAISVSPPPPPPSLEGGGADVVAAAAAAVSGRPWVGGEYSFVANVRITVPNDQPAPGSAAAAASSSSEAVAAASTDASTSADGGNGGGVMNGNGGVPKTPEPSRQLSSPMLDATDGGYRFASAAGCNFCQGATRGAFGETFCRHCGRAFRKARTERASDVQNSMAGFLSEAFGGSGAGESAPEVSTWNYCDEAIGTLAIWVHRAFRGRPERVLE